MLIATLNVLHRVVYGIAMLLALVAVPFIALFCLLFGGWGRGGDHA